MLKKCLWLYYCQLLDLLSARKNIFESCLAHSSCTNEERNNKVTLECTVTTPATTTPTAVVTTPPTATTTPTATATSTPTVTTTTITVLLLRNGTFEIYETFKGYELMNV